MFGPILMSPGCNGFLSAIMLNLCLGSGFDYYGMIQEYTGNHNNYEQDCNIYGKHLASVHSSTQIDQIMEICESQCKMVSPTCWIGLEIEVKNTAIESYWINDASIESSIINESWCYGYPMINYNTNIAYYTFIDSTQNCWKTTSNSTKKMWNLWTNNV